MRNNSTLPAKDNLRLYAVCSAVFLILLYRMLSGGLFTSLSGIPMIFEYDQFAYGVLDHLGLSGLLLNSNWLCLVLDIVLLSLPWLFLFIRKQWLMFLLLLLFTLYFMFYNMGSGHYYHGLVAVFVLCLPYLSSNPSRTEWLWQSGRYYFLYMFSSAALWKILRGSVFLPNQMSNILKIQHADSLLLQSDSWQLECITFLIAHPSLSQMLLVLTVLIQLSFLFGFFSRKLDTLILIVFILFTLINYLIMDIISFELLPFGLFLINWQKLASALFPQMEVDSIVKQR